MTRYSRLLIDPNRGRDDPTLIMRLSDGAVIPGNRKLDAAERDKRLRLYYEPYHRAIDAIIDQCLATGVAPVLLSIHSFTESWKHFTRPWHVGVLWDRDARLAHPLLEGFYAEGDLIVGDNEPYAGQLEGDCLWQHGAQRGLANAIVEVRQDLIRDAAGQAAWSEACAASLRRSCADTCAAGRTARTAAAQGAAPIATSKQGDTHDQARQDAGDRTRSGRLPPAGRAPAHAQRRAEHRPDEPGGLLPQLPRPTGIRKQPRPKGWTSPRRARAR